MAETSTTAICPMAKTCKGMVENPKSRYMMILPGLIFIVLGLVIIMYPQTLVWLVAIALIVMGLAMLMMVNFMRKIGGRVQATRG